MWIKGFEQHLYDEFEEEEEEKDEEEEEEEEENEEEEEDEEEEKEKGRGKGKTIVKKRFGLSLCTKIALFMKENFVI